MSHDYSSEQERKISKREALSLTERFQRYLGILFFLSAALGVYLLSSDPFLWMVASTHAYGLTVIILADIVLGIFSILAVRQFYLPGLVWAICTMSLMLGDLLTGPEFKMTILYFAEYLTGIWTWDFLLGTQILLIGVSLLGRKYAQVAARRKLTYFELISRKSRRDFIHITGLIGGFFVLAGGLAIMEAILPPSQSPPPIKGGNQLPQGAIANKSQLSTLSPVYFEYPVGYPNVLFKKIDGSIVALSLLCTHVCCQVNFSSANGELLCPCHGSLYDDSGKVHRGPAHEALPYVLLNVDSSGNIFPVGVSGPSPCSPDSESQY